MPFPADNVCAQCLKIDCESAYFYICRDTTHLLRATMPGSSEQNEMKPSLFVVLLELRVGDDNTKMLSKNRTDKREDLDVCI